MYCKNCGNLLNDDQEICLNCGVRKHTGRKYCEVCGEAVENELQVICLKCGASVEDKKTSNSSQDWGAPSSKYKGYSKLVMALICFLLGGIGVHNFMLGENKKGVFKILMVFCFGISWIFALIDLVKILGDTYEVDANAFI